MPAGMMVDASLRHLPPPRNTHVLAGEERNWDGGEGRVQAERPTCQKSAGARERPGR